MVVARAPCNELNPGRCQCTGPFGWTARPDNPNYACSLPEQVPGVSSSMTNQPKGEEKRLRGTPTSSPAPEESGGSNLFHRSGVGSPGSGLT